MVNDNIADPSEFFTVVLSDHVGSRPVVDTGRVTILEYRRTTVSSLVPGRCRNSPPGHRPNQGGQPAFCLPVRGDGRSGLAQSTRVWQFYEPDGFGSASSRLVSDGGRCSDVTNAPSIIVTVYTGSDLGTLHFEAAGRVPGVLQARLGVRRYTEVHSEVEGRNFDQHRLTASRTGPDLTSPTIQPAPAVTVILQPQSFHAIVTFTDGTQEKQPDPRRRGSVPA